MWYVWQTASIPTYSLMCGDLLGLCYNKGQVIIEYVLVLIGMLKDRSPSKISF